MSTPEYPWSVTPAYGQFMSDKELAEMLKHHLPALEQEFRWCSDFRAQPRIKNALHELRTAIDLLERPR